MAVPPDLKNSNFTPTSELQDAYLSLRQFLTLRTNEEIFLLSNNSDSIKTQVDDTQNGKSLAMSTIMSPDGAFLSKDMPKILQELGLKPDGISGQMSTDVGDINVFGATDTEYGPNLFKVFEINPAAFDVSNLVARDQKLSYQSEISKQIVALNEKAKPIREERDKLEEKKEEDRTQEDKDRIDELNTQIGKINDQRSKLVQESGKAFEDAARFTGERQRSVIRNDKQDLVSLYRHKSKYLDPASASSDYCNVFFNAIDSINLSLCVPYFRMNIIDRFAKKKGRLSKLSLSSFLNQSAGVTEDKIFYEAMPFTSNESTRIAKKLKSGKVVSMESFFAPQTLLPDPTEILSNPRRLDTSVPLLSLNSFSIGIETVGIALMSKKTADLSITLHDRSRLSDISPLVSVGNFSSLYFEIEWGWIHPHGDAKSDNAVARFLNNLRYKEIFSPVSYNMTMGENGSMNINIRLIGGTSIDAVNGSILNGGFLTRAYASQMLDRLIKSEIRDEQGEEAATEEIRAVTKVLIDQSRTADMIDRSFADRIFRYVDNVDRSSVERARLIEDLVQILKEVDYYKNEEIFNILKKNLPKIEKFAPAADNFQKIKKKYGDLIKSEDFTSVGGYLALLVGMPLAATGLYSEVQIHTFKFNHEAGAMADTQISDAPIRIQDVFKHPDQPGSLSKNTSVSNALALLGNYLSNPKQPLYEIASENVFNQIKVGDSTKESKDPVSAVDENAVSAAETFEKPEGFTTPNIRYIVRSVPAKEYYDDQAGGSTNTQSIANYVINSEKSVAQIIIYDANSSPNFDKIIGAYSYSKLKGKDGKKITPDFAKEIFKKSFPSIIYGAANSVLKSVNVSTDINNTIALQNIIDMGKDIYLARSKSDSSTDVGEISLFPGSVTVNMVGLPIIERGQEVYLDLGTGTTLDALYYVTSVKHDFRPGDYTTSLTLTYKGQGSVMSLTTMLKQFNNTQPKDQKAEIVEKPKESAPTKTTEKAQAQESDSQKNLLRKIDAEQASRQAEFSNKLEAENDAARAQAYARSLKRSP